MASRTKEHQLPKIFSVSNLERNLYALDRSDPELAKRIRLPVDGSRIQFGDGGDVRYRLHKSLMPLPVTPDELDAATEPARDATRVLVLGIGLGELVDRLLSDSRSIVAWDRDPWLLRLYLMRRDLSEWIASGKLKLALCADLLDQRIDGVAVVEHPFLREIYSSEIELLSKGLMAKRAAVCAGGLFVDPLSDALKSRGYSVWTIEIEVLSKEEIAHTMKRFAPSFVASINYTEGLVSFCAENAVRFLCWEIDPSLNAPRPLAGPADHTFVFTHRRANVEGYRAAGIQNVEYMPLATDPALRADLGPAEDGSLSFVGATMVEHAASFRGRFVEQYRHWRKAQGDTRPEVAAEGEALVQRVLDRQRRDFTRFVVPELLDAEAPGFVEAADVTRPELGNPVVLVGETAASEKRLTYLANLGALGVRVWGDAGWKLTEQHGVQYMGPAAHTEALTKIYNATSVNLDVGRLYQNDIVTMRVYDILACGSLVLAEHSAALEEVFEVGREVESYRDLAELRAKARYYKENPTAAQDIAMRGQEAVRSHHTVAQRLDHMLRAMG